jgi:uncharacterized membrane protein
VITTAELRVMEVENKEYRALAREQLKGNWRNPVLATLIYVAIEIPVSFIPHIGDALWVILTGPLYLGLATFYLNFNRKKDPKLEEVFNGFRNFKTAILLNFFVGLFVLLWALLFIIPGIIAALKYSMAYFVLSDNPDIGAMNAINESKELMKERKMQLFLLWLSFVGWFVCCLLTLGIGFLWFIPYFNLSMINFYENIKKKSHEGNQMLSIPLEPR